MLLTRVEQTNRRILEQNYRYRKNIKHLNKTEQIQRIIVVSDIGLSQHSFVTMENTGYTTTNVDIEGLAVDDPNRHVSVVEVGPRFSLGPPPAYPGPELKDEGNINDNQNQYQTTRNTATTRTTQPTQRLRTNTTSLNRPAPMSNKFPYTDESAWVTCQYCRTQMMTRPEQTPGLCGILGCVFCCLIGCWCGCCLLPLTAKGCNDINHKCTSCERTVGFYDSLGLE